MHIRGVLSHQTEATGGGEEEVRREGGGEEEGGRAEGGRGGREEVRKAMASQPHLISTLRLGS